jgi:hypothetical protein
MIKIVVVSLLIGKVIGGELAKEIEEKVHEAIEENHKRIHPHGLIHLAPLFENSPLSKIKESLSEDSSEGIESFLI